MRSHIFLLLAFVSNAALSAGSKEPTSIYCDFVMTEHAEKYTTKVRHYIEFNDVEPYFVMVSNKDGDIYNYPDSERNFGGYSVQYQKPRITPEGVSYCNTATYSKGDRSTECSSINRVTGVYTYSFVSQNLNYSGNGSCAATPRRQVRPKF